MTEPQTRSRRRSIYLDDSVWTQLADEAAADHRSTNGLLRVIVDEWLDAHSIEGNLRKLHKAWGGDGNLDAPSAFDSRLPMTTETVRTVESPNLSNVPEAMKPLAGTATFSPAPKPSQRKK